MSVLDDAVMADSRHTAFKILQRHIDCLEDDTPLQDLIEDIATAIFRAKMNREPRKE